MGNVDLLVTIPQEKYEYLVEISARVDVAVELVSNNESIAIEDILRILGTGLALQKADELRKLREERDKKWEDYRKHYEEECND